MSTWLSAEEIMQTEWDPPRLPYSDAPATIPCGLPDPAGRKRYCQEMFYTVEGRDLHRREAVHRSKKWPHGMRWYYLKNHCPCLICRRANADYVAEQRRKKS